MAVYNNVGCCILVSKLPEIYNEIHPLVHNENYFKLYFFKKPKFSNEKAVKVLRT